MKKALFLALMVMVVSLMTGCAATLPTNSYTPQNIVRVEGSIAVENFHYLPAEQGKVKANQIENTAVGSMYISSDVSEFVRRATALELEKSGIVLNEACPIALSGEIIEFKADDFGYSIDWTLRLRYIIKNKATNEILYDKIISPEKKKTGKFGLPSDYANTLGNIVLSAYDIFITDKKVKELLSRSKE